MFEHEQARSNAKSNSPSKLKPGIFKSANNQVASSSKFPQASAPHHLLKVLKVLPVNQDLEKLLGPSKEADLNGKQNNLSTPFSPSRAKPTQVLTICIEEEQPQSLDPVPSASKPNNDPFIDTESQILEFSLPSSSQSIISTFKSPIFVLFSSSLSPTTREGSKSAFITLDKILGSLTSNQVQGQERNSNFVKSWYLGSYRG